MATIYKLLMVALILSLIGISGCGGGDTEATSASTSSSMMSTPSDQPSGDLWSDVPIFAGVVQVQNTSFEQPASGDTLKFVEWKFFETSSDVATVTNFYKSQLPAKKWTKMMWVDNPAMSYGSYQKNNEARLCLVYVIASEDKTSINVMSASK